MNVQADPDTVAHVDGAMWVSLAGFLSFPQSFLRCTGFRARLKDCQIAVQRGHLLNKDSDVNPVRGMVLG